MPTFQNCAEFKTLEKFPSEAFVAFPVDFHESTSLKIYILEHPLGEHFSVGLAVVVAKNEFPF